METSSPPHNLYIVKIFFLVLLLTLLACLQIDNEFRAFKKIFSTGKSNKTEIAFTLAKAEPLQIQLVYRVVEKEPINAILSLTINGQKAQEIQARETKRITFVAPQALFKKGENKIAWNLTTSRPGFILDEIKLANHTGVNPNIPVAWVVPDELLNQSQQPDNKLPLATKTFSLVCLMVLLYITFSRLLLYNTLHLCLLKCRTFLIISSLLLSATLLYSFLSPQKIIFPTGTVLWLTGLSILSIQLPFFFANGNLDNSTPLKTTWITLTIICLISVVAYLSYFKNAWYVQDDYLSIHWSLGNPNIPISQVTPQSRTGGQFNAIIESTKSIVNLLYKGQGRYQPVRLFIFMIFMQFFQEEYSPYYNFALHLANLILLFFILQKFKVESVATLIIILLFSLFGRWRMMESPSAMIAGSGLNLFLISLTILFLIKALEQNNTTVKKTGFFCLSWFTYFCLVFSYEVAFPLILPLIYVFYTFGQKNKVAQTSELSPSWFTIQHLTALFKRQNIFYLTPYFILLSVYILFFNLTAKGTYPGTTISWSFADILTRLANYVDHTISLRINLNHLGAPEIVILFLYYALATLTVRSGKPSHHDGAQKIIIWKTLLFGLTLYFSSMVLFFLNSWETPKNIMVHHLYLMTAGASILTVTLFFQAQWFLPRALFLKKAGSSGKLTIIPLKKYYRNFLIFVFFPLALVSEGGYSSRYYTTHDVGTALIKPIKAGIMEHVNPEQTDAIIIKNFHYNYHGISSLEGAFMHWFNLGRIIASGRPILSADSAKIQFMRPLSHYWLTPNIKHETNNNRTQIFFLENNTVLPYHDFIHFEEGTNLYQTQQVWGDQEPEEFRHYRLDAILKNSNKDFLEIRAKSEEDLERLVANITRIELNSKQTPRVLSSGKSLFIDISSAKTTSNYFFLTLVSTDRNFKNHLQLIRLQNPEEVTVPRDIENIPIGADSWGIG